MIGERGWGPYPTFMAAILCMLMLGCGDNAPSAVDDSLSADEKVLLVLDSYEPIYQVNDAGRVTNITLHGQRLTPALLAEVGKLTELQNLGLYAANVNDEGLAHLRNLHKLEGIGLGANPITDKGLVHLEKLHSLRWMWLPRQTITDKGAEELNAALPGLRIFFQ